MPRVLTADCLLACGFAASPRKQKMLKVVKELMGLPSLKSTNGHHNGAHGLGSFVSPTVVKAYLIVIQLLNEVHSTILTTLLILGACLAHQALNIGQIESRSGRRRSATVAILGPKSVEESVVIFVLIFVRKELRIRRERAEMHIKMRE